MRWAGSHEVTDKDYINTKNSQMTSIGVITTSTYHTKQLNPWPNSSPSHVVNYSQLSACQGDIVSIWRQPKHLRMSDEPQKQGTAKEFQHLFLPELLVNVYSDCYKIHQKCQSKISTNKLYGTQYKVAVCITIILFQVVPCQLVA